VRSFNFNKPHGNHEIYSVTLIPKLAERVPQGDANFAIRAPESTMSSLGPFGDVAIVDSGQDVRIIVRVPGRYRLANRWNGAGERREFACRAVGMSPQQVVLAAPVIGAIGERVIAHIEQFGKIEGPISRVMSGGFVMDIGKTAEERGKLAAKIRWLEGNTNHDLPEGRKSKRIVPREPVSRILLADGSRLRCFVMDMSVSGASVSADLVPKIGLTLAVGKVPAVVVRLFAEGFAVRFLDPVELSDLEAMVIRP
jgi:hypothetical protein